LLKKQVKNDGEDTKDNKGSLKGFKVEKIIGVHFKKNFRGFLIRLKDFNSINNAGKKSKFRIYRKVYAEIRGSKNR